MAKLAAYVAVIIILIAVAALIIAIPDGNNAGNVINKPAIRIGFIGPLTGEAVIYGEPLRNGISLAVEEINSQGGIGGRMLEVIYEDGRCSGKESANAMQKLANVDGVKVVLGGLCSSESLAAVPIAEQSKVFLFSYAASSPDLTGISPFFARNYPSDSTQGIVLADAVYNIKKWRNVAVIHEQLDYPQGIYESFAFSFESLGGMTVKEEFATGVTDFRTGLAKLRFQNPDALFIITQTASSAERILRQLDEINWRPPLMISDATAGDAPTIERNAEILEGALAAEFGIDYNNPKFVHLIAAYKEKFNVEAVAYQSYLQTAYDSVYMLKDAIEDVGHDAEKLAEWFHSVKDWQGASGSVSIGENGDRASGHKLKVIKDGKSISFGE